MAGSFFQKLRFRKKIEITEEDRVTLPVILGVKPHMYLAVLYGGAILLILFFVLLYPGLSKPGSIGIISSEPRGAAVRIDNITLGYTPCSIFLPRGKRTVELVLPDFEIYREEVEVKWRPFASLFFPSKIEIKGNLASPDPAGALARSALEYMLWSAAGEPTDAFQHPMILSESVYRTGPAAKNPEIRTVMQGILDNSLRHVITKVSARDLLRAQFLLDSRGLSPSSLSVLASVQKIISQIGNYGVSSLWLSELLSGDAAENLIQSTWYRKNAGFTNTAGTLDILLQFPQSLGLSGIDFIAVEPGYLEKYGQNIIMPPMLIARFPVSQEAWNLFIEENSQWAELYRETLIENGLVGEDYLFPVQNPSYPLPAVPGISWYAAKAFCDWLNTKLPASLVGWELKLPSEMEWEYAARQVELHTGLLWEWCADAYAPLDFFPVHRETLVVLEKTAMHSKSLPFERSLRGGSWINPPGSTDIESRGSLPPETSSPFVGFRPIIVPKEDNR